MLELYPPCQADPPKFAAQSDYLKIESFQFIGASTVYKDDVDNLTAPFQSVAISWDVRSGGFPPVDDHPGSLSSVTLTGPNLGNGIALGPSGQQTFEMGELQQSETAKPFVLTAVGNCGKAQASLSAQLIYRPPVIESFTATPNDNDPKTGYVALGKPAVLSWKYAGLDYRDGVSIVGTDGQGKTVFNAKGIQSYSNQVNSLQVVPSANTRYSLQISGPGGSASDSLWVDVYNSKQDKGSWFYFQMTDESDILPCFMLAVFAPDAASAKSLAEAQNGGYEAEQVDVNAYLASCQ
ncbi:MAG: hypothetical protein OK474_01150 [Thaumarchaeota archaeon]|nr:hypothetical protein [Nitrososphaerota archaeon]